MNRPQNLLLIILFLALHIHYAYCQRTPPLFDRDIYNIQFVNAEDPGQGTYYPAKYSDVDSIKNPWLLYVDAGSAKPLIADTFSTIFDYRVMGDSMVVVIGRKIFQKKT